MLASGLPMVPAPILVVPKYGRPVWAAEKLKMPVEPR